MSSSKQGAIKYTCRSSKVWRVADKAICAREQHGAREMMCAKHVGWDDGDRTQQSGGRCWGGRPSKVAVMHATVPSNESKRCQTVSLRDMYVCTPIHTHVTEQALPCKATSSPSSAMQSHATRLGPDIDHPQKSILHLPAGIGRPSATVHPKCYRQCQNNICSARMRGDVMFCSKRASTQLLTN